MAAGSKSLIIILFLGLLIRILVMIWSFGYRENTDVLRYKDWGRISYLHGFSDTYKPDHLTFGTLPNNQPPGSVYTIGSMYYLHLYAAKAYLRFHENTPEANAFIIGPIQNTFLRLPQLFADSIIAVIIYLLVRLKRDQKQAVIGAALYVFNPAVIYNSAFWGQMDSLNNVFFILSVYLLFRSKYTLSIVSYFLSLYIKFSVIFLMPLYFLISTKLQNKIKPAVLGIITALVVLLVLTLPISVQPHTWFISFFTGNSIGEMEHITNFAFNFWWMIFKPAIKIGENTDLYAFSQIHLVDSPMDSQTFMTIPLHAWGIILFVLTAIPLYWYVFKTKKTLPVELALLFFSLSALLGFLFLPRMHERYLFPLFPILSSYVAISQRKLWVYVFLSLFNLLNLYIVWHPMRVAFFPYEGLNNPHIQWIISVGIFLVSTIWYIQSIRELYAKKNH